MHQAILAGFLLYFSLLGAAANDVKSEMAIFSQAARAEILSRFAPTVLVHVAVGDRNSHDQRGIGVIRNENDVFRGNFNHGRRGHPGVNDTKAVKLALSLGAAHNADRFYADVGSWSLPKVLDLKPNPEPIFIQSRTFNPQVGPDLRLTDLPLDADRLDRSAVRLPSQKERHDQKGSTQRNKENRPPGVVSHPLSGVVHGLRSRVHALLGNQVFFLALGGFFFAALTGLGGGLILDNFNTNRRIKILGWTLLCLCLPLSGLGLFLGLP